MVINPPPSYEEAIINDDEESSCNSDDEFVSQEKASGRAGHSSPSTSQGMPLNRETTAFVNNAIVANIDGVTYFLNSNSVHNGNTNHTNIHILSLSKKGKRTFGSVAFSTDHAINSNAWNQFSTQSSDLGGRTNRAKGKILESENTNKYDPTRSGTQNSTSTFTTQVNGPSFAGISTATINSTNSHSGSCTSSTSHHDYGTNRLSGRNSYFNFSGFSASDNVWSSGSYNMQLLENTTIIQSQSHEVKTRRKKKSWLSKFL